MSSAALRFGQISNVVAREETSGVNLSFSFFKNSDYDIKTTAKSISLNSLFLQDMVKNKKTKENTSN